MKNEMIPVTLGHYFELRNANVTHRHNLRPRTNRVETIDTRLQIGENRYNIGALKCGMKFQKTSVIVGRSNLLRKK